ncbi:MAG: hypothetical protein RIR97_1244 [Pseudomonadota bacterium]
MSQSESAGRLDQPVQTAFEASDARLAVLRQMADGAIGPDGPDLLDLSFPSWIKDGRGRYISCNPAFETLTGHRRDVLIGRRDDDFASASHASLSFRQDMQAMSSRDILTFDLVLPSAFVDRRLKGTVAKAAIRDRDGRITGIAAIALQSGMEDTELKAMPDRPQKQEDAEAEVRQAQDFSAALESHYAGFTADHVPFALIMLEIQLRRAQENRVLAQLPCPVVQALMARLRLRLKGRGEPYFAGADRIAIFLPGTGCKNKSGSLALELKTECLYPVECDGALYQVIATSGFAVIRTDDDSADALIRRAMPASLKRLATAPQPPQAASVAVAPSHPKSSEYELQADMAAGIERQEFIAYFQPKMDLLTRTVVGAEALVRWKHPKLGLIPPSMFIVMAEQIGLLQAINQHIWRQSMDFVRALNDNQAGTRRVAINLSAADLQVPGFVSSIETLMAETGCPASFLEFEITESALKARSEQLEAHLAALDALGIGLAIDDFGTGNLAFEALNRFPIRTLKIDRVFIKDIATHEKTARLVRAMCLMADELGLVTVAEGVETPIEAELAKQVGCKQGQGFFWQRPLPERKFLDWLRVQAPFNKV